MTWTIEGEGLDPPPGYDFLDIVLAALTARGLNDSVAAVPDNAQR